MSLTPNRIALLLVLCTPMAHGQVVTAPPAAETAQADAALLERIRAAYYHPGKVAISCDAALDFSSALTKLGDTEGAKSVAGLKLHVVASDSKNAEVTFAWPSKGPAADERSQVEASVKQVIGGFFQAYWPLANAEMVPPVKDHPVVAPVTGGGYTITTPVPAGTGTSRLVVESNWLVKRAETRAAGQNSTLTLTYSASPNPHPGDTMRLSGITVGTPTGGVQATMTWDDQTVSGIFLPHRASVAIPGAFEVPFTLSNCTVAPDPGAR